MPKRTPNDLLKLVETLRGEGGCPWDREQTLSDVISFLIEEGYELEWANQTASAPEIAEELGDVLFLVCFTTALLREKDSSVTIESLSSLAYDKIKRRHPHVFGDKKASNKSDSHAHWNRVKDAEKCEESAKQSALENVEGNFPPIKRAEKLQRSAAKVGFDWDDVSGIMDKLREEVEEAGRCLREGSVENLKMEIGDLLFTVINLSRFVDISAESALSGANAKFVSRFQEMETLIKRDNKEMKHLTLAEMDVYWEQVKSHQKE